MSLIKIMHNKLGQNNIGERNKKAKLLPKIHIGLNNSKDLVRSPS
jgi:hypothetical protein